jgi:hypothetical protein
MFGRLCAGALSSGGVWFQKMKKKRNLHERFAKIILANKLK